MVTSAFNPQRLTLARMRRGMQLKELAERCGVDVRTVGGWENNEWPPMGESLAALARVLRFPAAFFSAPRLDLIDVGRASFRSMSTMKAPQRDAVHAAGTLVLPFQAWLASRFSLPALAVPDFGGEDPEQAADSVRKLWGLGHGPAPNMVHLLELHGVRVFSLAEDAREVDAFSFWGGAEAFVMLNTMKSPEHGRFDAAHELGHLVLHRRADLRSNEVEHEANRFASAFLLPRAGVLAQRPPAVTMQVALAMKVQWRVSLIAMVFRLHRLGLVTDWHYRELNKAMALRGWRTAEPYGLTKRETSQVLAKAFGPLRGEGGDVRDVAKHLYLPIEEVQRMIFGLVLADPPPETTVVAKPPPPVDLKPFKPRVVAGTSLVVTGTKGPKR